VRLDDLSRSRHWFVTDPFSPIPSGQVPLVHSSAQNIGAKDLVGVYTGMASWICACRCSLVQLHHQRSAPSIQSYNIQQTKYEATADLNSLPLCPYFLIQRLESAEIAHHRSGREDSLYYCRLDIARGRLARRLSERIDMAPEKSCRCQV
jgi:hypothetical protein